MKVFCHPHWAQEPSAREQLWETPYSHKLIDKQMETLVLGVEEPCTASRRPWLCFY